MKPLDIISIVVGIVGLSVIVIMIIDIFNIVETIKKTLYTPQQLHMPPPNFNFSPGRRRHWSAYDPKPILVIYLENRDK